MNLCSETGVRYLFLDLNSYFASCEQQDFPDLRGEPVIVVPCDTDSTCAIAASYEAKAFGIRTGTKVWEAKRACPGLRVVPARHDAYVKYHHEVLEEFVRHTPLRKVWSIDECDSRLMPRHQSREAAEALGLKIKAGLKQNVGEWIRASIGIAPNSFLGKMATELQKPDGLVIVEGRDLPHRLLGLDLRDLCGIGPGNEKRLRRAGIYTVEDLWRCDPKRARKIWGSVAGEKFWYNLHGVEIQEQETSRSVIGHSRVLDPELRDHAGAYQVARRLTTKAVQRLRREGFLATGFCLSVRGVERERFGMEYRLPQSDALKDMLAALDVLWEQVVTHSGVGRIKLVAIHMHGLIEGAHATGDLFRQPDIAPARRPGVEKAMDHINKKFGAQTINLGIMPELHGGRIGTKIAFSRIPDQAEFWE